MKLWTFAALACAILFAGVVAAASEPVPGQEVEGARFAQADSPPAALIEADAEVDEAGAEAEEQQHEQPQGQIPGIFQVTYTPKVYDPLENTTIIPYKPGPAVPTVAYILDESTVLSTQRPEGQYLGDGEYEEWETEEEHKARLHREALEAVKRPAELNVDRAAIKHAQKLAKKSKRALRRLRHKASRDAARFKKLQEKQAALQALRVERHREWSRARREGRRYKAARGADRFAPFAGHYAQFGPYPMTPVYPQPHPQAFAGLSFVEADSEAEAEVDADAEADADADAEAETEADAEADAEAETEDPGFGSPPPGVAIFYPTPAPDPFAQDAANAEAPSSSPLPPPTPLVPGAPGTPMTESVQLPNSTGHYTPLQNADLVIPADPHIVPIPGAVHDLIVTMDNSPVLNYPETPVIMVKSMADPARTFATDPEGVAPIGLFEARVGPGGAQIADYILTRAGDIKRNTKSIEAFRKAENETLVAGDQLQVYRNIINAPFEDAKASPEVEADLKPIPDPDLPVAPPAPGVAVAAETAATADGVAALQAAVPVVAPAQSLIEAEAEAETDAEAEMETETEVDAEAEAEAEAEADGEQDTNMNMIPVPAAVLEAAFAQEQAPFASAEQPVNMVAKTGQGFVPEGAVFQAQVGPSAGRQADALILRGSAPRRASSLHVLNSADNLTQRTAEILQAYRNTAAAPMPEAEQGVEADLRA